MSAPVFVGQKIKCRQSFSAKYDYTGIYFEVCDINIEDKTFRVFYTTEQGESSRLPFCFSEYEIYFCNETSNKKCDCGFVVGVSAVHYSWCQTVEVGAISA